MASRDEQASTLPGVLPTLAAGFDTVTAHLWLVLIPILLDLFYWIGPRLSSRRLMLDLVELFREAGVMPEMTSQLAEMAERTNLFTLVSVPYLGVPGLMAGFVMPAQTPMSPSVREVSEPLVWLGLFVALIVLGLVVATVYYGLVAVVVREDHFTTPNVARFLSRLPLYWLRIFGLALALLFIVLAIYLPLMVFTTLVALLSPAAASLVMFSGFAIILWLIFHLSFSMHGILLRERPVLWALLDSLRLVRRHWLPALILIMAVLLVRTLSAWLWLAVDTGSWLTLASIVGYAFVNTAMVAAMFVFYRDRYDAQLLRQQRI
ncbi:MAG TPA: hypothetical protein VK879_04760 [Candidatus Sulfomarinibacteraceae bacterium]|nr:hypothetical protein [Candidatus Sulfomarinibacteraceae bacterium]